MFDLEPALYWIRERELIRRKREHPDWARRLGEVAFTDDPILQKYRFCNVRREDDRVTRWIAAEIRRPFQNSPDLWWMLCVARTINLPASLGELIEKRAWPFVNPGFQPEMMTQVLEARQARGEKLHTGAYMIRAESNKNVPWYKWSKAKYLCEIVLGRLWQSKIDFTSMESAHKDICAYHGWGPFMAYQALVDMRFTPVLERSPDISRWAAAGPGTLRGIRRLMPHAQAVPDPTYTLEGKYTAQPVEAVVRMRTMYPEFQRAFAEVSDNQLDFSDVPNILCEVDKYLRVKNGEGKPRSLYRPNKEPMR